MKQIAIFGSRGFGREVAMLVKQINQKKEEWQFIGFFDDGVEKGKIINNFPVLGGIGELNNFSESLGVIIAIGNPLIKKKIHQSISNSKIFFPSLIHPTVLMGDSEFLSMGEGCIIAAGTIITVNIKIGNHVILNLLCTVGHDSIIKDYSSVMPTVNISGEVVINECVYLGTGVQVINRLEIGKETIVGAGAVVSNSLPDRCTAVGVPAKPIKFH